MPSLPPGWLKHDWVELVSIVKEADGTERITTSPIDEARLFDWIKSTQRNSVTPKQYRDALRRMCLDFGAGYRKSQLRDDVRDHLAARIHELGRKNWACARAAARPKPAKKVKLQHNPATNGASSTANGNSRPMPAGASLGMTSTPKVLASQLPVPPTLLSSLASTAATSTPALTTTQGVPAVVPNYLQQQAPLAQAPLAQAQAQTTIQFQQQQQQQPAYYQVVQQPNGQMMQVPLMQVMSSNGQQMFVPHQQQQYMLPQQQQQQHASFDAAGTNGHQQQVQHQQQQKLQSQPLPKPQPQAQAPAQVGLQSMDDYRSLFSRLSQSNRMFAAANTNASTSTSLSASMSSNASSSAAPQQPQLYAPPPQYYQYQQQQHMFFQPPQQQQQHFHHQMTQQVQYQQQYQPQQPQQLQELLQQQYQQQPLPQSKAPAPVQDLLSHFKLQAQAEQQHQAPASAQDLLSQFKPAAKRVKTEYRSDAGRASSANSNSNDSKTSVVKQDTGALPSGPSGPPSSSSSSSFPTESVEKVL